jgi:hypothetical protein
MVLFSASMLIIRCTTIVLFGILGKKLVFAYLGLDLILYIFVKLLRADFWYWAPQHGLAEVLISVVARVMIKVITDFTSCVHFRHPNEVGGLYWIASFVLTIGSLPLAMNIAAQQENAKTGVELGRTFLKYLLPATLLCFAVFFKSINKSHWKTFWSAETAPQRAIRSFSEAEDDKVKAQFSLSVSRHYWAHKDVELWVTSNWRRWEEEQPEWLDKATRALVPIEFIPTAEAKRKESLRRASIDADSADSLGDAIKARIRRASIGSAYKTGNRIVPISQYEEIPRSES